MTVDYSDGDGEVSGEARRCCQRPPGTLARRRSRVMVA
jgi:hypothetical protein